MFNSQSHPSGIRVAARLQIIAGCLGLLFGCTVVLNIFVNLQADGIKNEISTTLPAGFGEVLPMLLLSAGQIVMGFGVLQLKPWSWLGSLTVQFLCLLYSLLPLSQSNVPELTGLIPAVTIIYFLLKPDVRMFFRRGRTR